MKNKRTLSMIGISVEEAADAELAAGDPGDHLVLDDERRRRLAVARPVIGNLRVPLQVAGPRVDAHEVRVEGRHI